MINHEFGTRAADLNSAERYRRYVKRRLACDTDVEASQAAADRAAFLGFRFFARRPPVSDVFETAFMADNNVATAWVKLHRGDRSNVDG